MMGVRRRIESTDNIIQHEPAKKRIERWKAAGRVYYGLCIEGALEEEVNKRYHE